MIKTHYYLFTGLLILLFSCHRTKENQSTNKFNDPLFEKIANLQDRRSSDSLLIFLSHPVGQYRQQAALAFASIQDTSVLADLASVLMNDQDKKARINSALAIGQTPALDAESFLKNALKKERDPDVLCEIIEAYGKVAKNYNLEASILSTKDSLKLLNGKAWSFYRFGLRMYPDSVMINEAKKFLSPRYDENTRLAAAHFFSRSKAAKITSATAEILRVLNDLSPDVRMAAALSLRKLGTASLIPAKHIVESEADARVRVNAVRALSALPFSDTKAILISALNDSNTNVSVTAAEVISATMKRSDVDEIWPIAASTKNMRARAQLYEGMLANSENQKMVNEVIDLYDHSANDYQRAFLLKALGQALEARIFVMDKLLSSEVLVIKSSAAMALAAMNRKTSFPQSLQNTFLGNYKRGILTGDPVVIGVLAEALADSSLHYKKLIRDIDFLYEARKQFSLPKDYEALVSLEHAIAYFEKRAPQEIAKDPDQSIDWNLIKQIPNNQKVVIETTKGNIVIRLFPEEAPGSVANFVKLVNQSYYNGKYFHRVVPNFVIQAGCNRGDGWGSEDYFIRSEFSDRKYTTGSVGMASAGKDTEGTQWFITHSPTPHLDGRYTIFAEVEDGMEVVNRIEVGDQIIKISLLE